MPAFPIRSAKDLSDFLIPVTPEIATEIIAQANSVNDGIAYAAVYYWTGTPENRKRASILITLTLEFTDDLFGFVRTGEYHPRKDGKAELEFKTDTLVRYSE